VVDALQETSQDLLNNASDGVAGQKLSSIIGFGTSMLPFIPPGKDIWLETVPATSIRTGDIITYQEKPDALISHRVIKIHKKNGSIVFITKGDNRSYWDPLVAEHQIIGRVTHIGNTSLKRFWWQWIGRLIAWGSYVQGTIYQYFAKSWLNHLRHALEEKRLFPKIHVYSALCIVGNPLAWIVKLEKIIFTCRVLIDRHRLTQQGIQIGTWTPQDTEAMLKVWNKVFPNHKTSLEQFTKRLCGSRWFDPANCFLIRRGNELLGWALANLRQDQFEPSAKTKNGFIEVAALTDAVFKCRSAQVLIYETLKYFKKNKIKKIFVGPHRIEDAASGIPLVSLSKVLAKIGFRPVRESVELRVKHNQYRSIEEPVNIPDLNIRFAQISDTTAIGEFFDRNQYPFGAATFGSTLKIEGKKRMLVATLKDRVVACCCILLDEQITDFSDLSWVWSVAESTSRTGYFFGLIADSEFRRNGIGSAMATKAFESLFQSGCEEIALSIKQEGFYEDFYKRFGFKRKGRYAAWKKV